MISSTTPSSSSYERYASTPLYLLLLLSVIVELTPNMSTLFLGGRSELRRRIEDANSNCLRRLLLLVRGGIQDDRKRGMSPCYVGFPDARIHIEDLWVSSSNTIERSQIRTSLCSVGHPLLLEC